MNFQQHHCGRQPSRWTPRDWEDVLVGGGRVVGVVVAIIVIVAIVRIVVSIVVAVFMKRVAAIVAVQSAEERTNEGRID